MRKYVIKNHYHYHYYSRMSKTPPIFHAGTRWFLKEPVVLAELFNSTLTLCKLWLFAILMFMYLFRSMQRYINRCFHLPEIQNDARNTKHIEAFQLLFLLIPPENRELLHSLLMLLHLVYDNQHNKMTARNLAVVFSPNIMHKKKVCDLGHFSNISKEGVLLPSVEKNEDVF